MESNTFSEALTNMEEIVRKFSSTDLKVSTEEKRRILIDRRKEFTDTVKKQSNFNLYQNEYLMIFKEMFLNPNVHVDLQKIFQLKNTSPVNADQIVFLKVDGNRLGPSTGSRNTRDNCICIMDLPAIESIITITRNACLCVWSKEFKLQLCTGVCLPALTKDKSWVMDCAYVPRLKRLVVCTEKWLCIVDPKFPDFKQLSYIIRPTANRMLSVAYVPPDPLSTQYPATGDSLLVGDAGGCVWLLTLDVTDASNVETSSDKKNNSRIVEIKAEKLISGPIHSRKLHKGEIIKIRFFQKLRKFISCCESSVESFIVDTVDVITRKTAYKSINVPGGVLCFDCIEAEQLVLTGGKDRRLRVWRLADLSAPVASLPGHVFSITSIAVNETDRHAYTMSADDRLVRAWHLDSFQCLQAFKPLEDLYGDKRMNAMTFIEKYGCLITGSSLIDVWPLRRIALTKSEGDLNFALIDLVSYSTVHRHLVAASRCPPAVYVFDMHAKNLRHVVPTKDKFQPIAMCVNNLEDSNDVEAEKNGTRTSRGDEREVEDGGRRGGSTLKPADSGVLGPVGLKAAVVNENSELVVYDIGTGKAVKSAKLLNFVRGSRVIDVKEMMYVKFSGVQCLVISFNSKQIMILSDTDSSEFHLLKLTSVPSLLHSAELNQHQASAKKTVHAMNVDLRMKPLCDNTENTTDGNSINRSTSGGCTTVQKSYDTNNDVGGMDGNSLRIFDGIEIDDINGNSADDINFDCKRLSSHDRGKFSFSTDAGQFLILDVPSFEILTFELLESGIKITSAATCQFYSNSLDAITDRSGKLTNRSQSASSNQMSNKRILIVSCDNGDLIAYDYHQMDTLGRYNTEYSSGICCLATTGKTPLVFSGHLHGFISSWVFGKNNQHFNLESRWMAHDDRVSNLEYINDQRILISSSSLGIIKFWTGEGENLYTLQFSKDQSIFKEISKNVPIKNTQKDLCKNKKVDTCDEKYDVNKINCDNDDDDLDLHNGNRDNNDDDDDRNEENCDNNDDDLIEVDTINKKTTKKEEYFTTLHLNKQKPLYNECDTFKRSEENSIYLTLPLYAPLPHYLNEVIELMRVPDDEGF